MSDVLRPVNQEDIVLLWKHLDTLQRDHEKLLFALCDMQAGEADLVICRNAACATGERLHVAFGDVPPAV